MLHFPRQHDFLEKYTKIEITENIGYPFPVPNDGVFKQ